MIVASLWAMKPSAGIAGLFAGMGNWWVQQGRFDYPSYITEFFLMITGLNRLSNQARVQSGIYNIASQILVIHLDALDC